MALNITTGTATTVANNSYGIFIQVNAALTGNIVVGVAGSTQYGTSAATIATITNPNDTTYIQSNLASNTGCYSIVSIV